jgi:hypothetical protein
MTDPSERLALSQSHLMVGERLIARQSALISRLADAGIDVRDAWSLLSLFEEVQSRMLTHHRSILRDMEAWEEKRRRR